MNILENELIVRYDKEQERLNIYRIVGSDREVINTPYLLSDLKLKGIHESGRLIGEDILLSLKGTRNELGPETIESGNNGKG